MDKNNYFYKFNKAYLNMIEKDSLITGNILKSLIDEQSNYMRLINGPLVQIIETQNKLNDVLSPVFKNWSLAVTDSTQSILKTLTYISRSINIDPIIKNVMVIRESLVPSMTLFADSINKMLQQVQPNLKNLNVSNYKPDINEIQSTIDDCIEESGFLTQEKNIERKIAEFFSSLKDKHPVIAYIVTVILIPILITILISNNSSYTENVTKNNYNMVINITKRGPQNIGIHHEVMKGFRFVSRDGLRVREGKSNKSRVIAHLRIGQIVRVIYIKKNWTLISWYDSGGKEYEGWVFTRYIKRFKF